MQYYNLTLAVFMGIDTQFENMEFKKEYKFKTWSNWADIMANAIDDFQQSYSIHPNIIAANEHTYSQIDFLVNIIPEAKDNVFQVDELTNESIPLVDHSKHININSFGKDGCHLDFAVENEIGNKYFMLVYDSDLDWDNDEENKPVYEPEREKVLA